MNKRQRLEIVRLLESKMGSVKGRTVALLGLAFKAGTDDIREAPALDIIRALQEKGARVQAYDPQAAENVRAVFPDVTYAKNVRDALAGADACLILTEWDEFRALGAKDFYGVKVVIEGRRVLSHVPGTEGVCW